MKQPKSEDEKSILITCQVCRASFKRKKSREAKQPLLFCAYCGTRLHETEKPKTEKEELSSKASLLQEHVPDKSEIQGAIGQYQILRSIGKGGMGEVFLAYDTVCGRRIALKRIRQDLLENPQLQKRFLREARITSQLTHPAIIPIYSIDAEKSLIYYSMPYVEGPTLKQMLKTAREQSKRRDKRQDPHGSIPFLIRHFLQVCQAVAYAHSKGVLHRDLKPENIIVGNYGQILILDWGLAKLMDSGSADDEPVEDAELITYSSKNLLRLTRIGKVVGTIAYMAPERAFGKPATVLTDIYSLGVMLYQILTLQIPFQRKNLSTFKKTWKQEQFIPPETIAPYREVPQILSEIAKKCLATKSDDRYASVDELILSLENYLEGRSEWFSLRKLDVENKQDWLFQENILIAEHTAITRITEASDWVSLMISKDTFPDNTKLDATVKLGSICHGIGFMLSIPEAHELPHLTEGYCLWLGAEGEEAKKTKLLRSSVSVLEAPEIVLKRDEWQHIRLEKIDHHIYFYLNDQLQFSYISHIPVIGTHIGVLARDADFEIKDLEVSAGSQNITINCLAVPDAFLANKDYDRALSEYRRIGTLFPGRAEGREALFRAGVTLLEKARHASDETQAHEFYDLAQDEFSKLRSTPGAPLEYLGKALVYQTLNEYEEEVKCFELAIRRYKNHPLLPILEEQILFRMHETSRQNRVAAYHFVLLVARFLPHLGKNAAVIKLFSSLQRHWEHLPFLPEQKEELIPELKAHRFTMGLCFWLSKSYVLLETVEDMLEMPILPMAYIVSTLLAAVELGASNQVAQKMQRIRALLSEAEQVKHRELLELVDFACQIQSQDLQEGLRWLQKLPSKTMHYLEEYVVTLTLRCAIQQQKLAVAKEVQSLLEQKAFQFSNQELIDALLLEAMLYQNEEQGVLALIEKYPIERFTQESSHLYFPYGCWIAKKEGQAQALNHFSKVLDVAFPRSWLLAAHYLTGKIHTSHGGWFARSFMWERRKLYSQLALFWHCLGNPEKSYAWHLYESKEFVHE